MAGFKEVLFIADENDPASSVDCFDLQLGNKIGMYPSGHGVVRGSLQILNEEYFMSAEICKPPLRGSSNLHVWSIDTRNQLKRISISGEVTALGVSADSFYCAVGINNKILLWNIASGQLLNTVSYHHEPIGKILFWNSSYFVTCGSDGLVAVWRLADIISRESGDCFGPSSTNYQTPFYSSSKHSLPITDIFLAPAGNMFRLFTVSADQNCNIFSIGLDTGKYLLGLTYDFVLTSVLCDHLQRMLYVGTTCGRVIIFPMEYNAGAGMRHVTDEHCLLGHSGAVRALSITKEDDLLATGSEDRKVIVWNVSTKQQIHTCDMHGLISNLLFHVVKGDFLSPGPSPKTVVSSFDRNILADPDNMEIKICVKNEVSYDDDVAVLEDVFLFQSSKKGWCMPGRILTDGEEEAEVELRNESDSDTDVEMVSNEELIDDEPLTADYKRMVKLKRQVAELKAVNRRLKRVNKKLYIFGLEQVWQKRNVRDINA